MANRACHGTSTLVRHALATSARIRSDSSSERGARPSTAGQLSAAKYAHHLASSSCRLIAFLVSLYTKYAYKTVAFQSPSWLTLLVKSQICRKQLGYATFETQKDRDLAPVKRTLATVEITLL